MVGSGTTNATAVINCLSEFNRINQIDPSKVRLIRVHFETLKDLTASRADQNTPRKGL
jgi:hypothetical protein